MALVWSLDASFYFFVTVVQLALAALLVSRRPRSEWAWVLALLFLLNGVLSARNFIRYGYGWSDAKWIEVNLGMAWIDPTTSVLILYLALVLPRRVTAFRTRPWTLRALVFLPWLAWLTLVFSDIDYEISIHGPLLQAFGNFFVPVIGWIAVLFRWTKVLVTERSPIVLRQFQFVFAAFGVRASNFGVYDPVRILLGQAATSNLFGMVWAAVVFFHLGVLVWSVCRLLRARYTGTLMVRSATGIILAFYLIGAVEASWAHVAAQIGGPINLFSEFDLYALRPALVWMALVRYDLLGSPVRSPATGVGVTASLALVAVFFGARNALLAVVVDPGSAAVLAGVVALGSTAVLVAVVRPYLLPTQDERTATLAPYLVQLEDEFAARPPDPHRLARLRDRFRVPEGRHDDLVSLVRQGWTHAPESIEWLPGEKVGQYRLEGLLGEGGMAETHLATDLLSGTRVALKRTRHLDRGARQALLREAHIVGTLDHQNIVPLLAIARAGDEPVLVFPYLERGSLKGRLAKKGALPEDEAIQIIGEVLAGLEAAHARGIVHRDVKPANVLFDERGRAKLADFGVARRAPATAELGDPTRTGWQPGTVRYMAPEQARGLSVDGRSDLFAAGAVLFEIVTGEPLVPDSLSEYDALKMVAEGDLLLRSKILPAGLRPVLERALARLPEARFPDAASFRAALADRGRAEATGPRQ